VTLTLRAALALLPLPLLAAEPPAAVGGTWEITRVLPTTNTQVAPPPNAVGKRFTYSGAAADLAGVKIEDPQYSVRKLTSADFAVDYRIPPSELGVNSGEIRVVEVLKGGKPATEMGATLFLAGRRRLVTVWDGVFYELRPAKPD
jgi:hypothetical protein